VFGDEHGGTDYERVDVARLQEFVRNVFDLVHDQPLLVEIVRLDQLAVDLQVEVGYAN